MKVHTEYFKEKISSFGREMDCRIYYGQNYLGVNELNNVSFHYNGDILKSVMAQLDLDSNVELPLETEVRLFIGINVGGVVPNFEYIDFGKFIVYKVEKQEDARSWKITCYDKMLYAMKDYENMGLTYPVSVRTYIKSLCDTIGLVFKNRNETFPNYNREIPYELFLSSDGESLNYTYRDVLDQLAEVTGSIICINSSDELEIRYPTATNDGIDEEFISDTNVNIGQKYGPVNAVVLSRSDADNVYLRDEESVSENGLCEIKIIDNQIMNFNDRSDYLPDLLTALDGLEYYTNDYNSTGILYYEVGDFYDVSVGANTYKCLMLNDEINISQGIKEIISTELPETSVTDYTKADKTDRKINQTYIMVDKQNAIIEQLVEQIQPISNTIIGNGTVTLENAYQGTLHRLEITGSLQGLFPSNDLTPNESLTPFDFVLTVDNNSYLLGIDYLNYTSVESHDTYIYEDGKQWIERANGTIEQLDDLTITVNRSSEISLASLEPAQLKCIYLLDNEWTDTFAPDIDLVAKINLIPGVASINANKIKLEGYTTINENFGVDLEGNMWARNGSFSGNIYLEDGNKILGGDGLYSCLSFTSVGRFSGWDILGFGVNGYTSSLPTTRYEDVFVNAYIPENFVIDSAFIVLECSSMNSAYDAPDGSYTVVGTPKKLKLFKGDDNTSVSFFYYPYQAVDEYTTYSGTEVENAFGKSTYDPEIGVPGSVETVKTVDISSQISNGLNTFFVRSTITPMPKTTSFRPSGGSYDIYNYSEIVSNTGVARLSLYVFGYMNINEEV